MCVHMGPHSGTAVALSAFLHGQTTAGLSFSQDSWILSLEQHADAFARSFGLLQLLAIVRLLLFALPQRSSHDVNAVLCRGRRLLKAAPLCLGLALCCLTVAGMPTGPASSGHGLALDSSSDEVEVVYASPSGPFVFARDRHREPGRPPGSTISVATADVPPLSLSGEPDACLSFDQGLSDAASIPIASAWSFPVRVLQLQRPALCVPVAVRSFGSLRDLLRQLELKLDADLMCVDFIPVEPQPTTDSLVLLSVPRTCEAMFLVPTCVQLYKLGGT